jgi:hypothetical protein
VLLLTATVAAGTPALSPATPVQPAAQDATRPATAPIATSANTSNYLALPGGPERSAFGNASLDLGAAAAIDSARLQESFVDQTTVEAFRSAPNSSARVTVLERAADDIENRTTAIRRYQRRSIGEFTAGRITAETLFKRFAVVDVRAREVRNGIRTIQQTTTGYSVPAEVDDRFDELRQATMLYSTDQRTSIRRALVGDRSRLDQFVSTTDGGLVLAKIARGEQTYEREAYIDGRYRQSGDDRFNDDFENAYDFALGLYPWADENRVTSPGVVPLGVHSVYRINIHHAHGELVTYLDGASADVFLEEQVKRLSVLPPGQAVTGTNETADLTVEANLSHPTGPMQVTVRDSVTGTAEDARIRVDGQYVGQTGEDGRLWTLQPDASVRVEAAVGNETVSVTGVAD